MLRSTASKLIDAATFPLRAVWLFHQDKLGLSSLATERFDYVAREITGYCLDVGCGKGNRFITEFASGNGVGIDVYPYEGLSQSQVFDDLTHFPFDDLTFDTVTFIANFNHIPLADRDAEASEAYRCLKWGGKVVITMGHPLAEVAVHKLVWLYDRLLRTHVDMDSQRGMQEGESYYVTDNEIIDRLTRAGFTGVKKKRFWTQWGLNHLFVSTKARPE